MYFDDLDINDDILDAIYDMHFEKCTPIQEQCIPQILKGNDILGVAQTGTGKTAAYLLPILSKIADGGYPKDSINCIVMSPTRELAQQIDQAMEGFSYYINGISSVAVYGGNDGNRYNQEIKSLKLGADVIIATPGRLISHLTLGNIDMSYVSFFILDEADRMLDMGFYEDIMTIAKNLPASCQKIMFSATMPVKIEQLAKTILNNPVEVKIAVSKPAEKIRQYAYICFEPQKLTLIKAIFHNDIIEIAGETKERLRRVIVFCSKKTKVKDVNRSLRKMNINSGEMHSDLSQSERDEIMFKFKSEQIDVLVATDILSRGIDIDDITMVINYDVPHDAEDYVHRIGRTARADKNGIAITFINDVDYHYFRKIEFFLDKEIEKLPLLNGMEVPIIKENAPKTKKSRGRNTSHKQSQGNHRKKTHGLTQEKMQGNTKDCVKGQAKNKMQNDTKNKRRRKPQHHKTQDNTKTEH